MMKTIISALVILLAVTFQAQAQHYSRGCKTPSRASYTYVSGYSSCGCPLYTKRVTIGRSCNGYPIYRYYSVPSSCRCRVNYYRGSSYNRGHCSTPRQSHYYRGRGSSAHVYRSSNGRYSSRARSCR